MAAAPTIQNATLSTVKARFPDKKLRATDFRAIEEAVVSGSGIGFMPCWEAARRGGLVEIMPSIPDWSAPLWIVTHVDLHRTHKVQTFLTYLKAAAKEWGL